jgi:flagellar assembly protein FliH
MSPDANVLPVVFPVLTGTGQARWETQGQARGHVAGFAAGMRAAQDEIETTMARLEAEQTEFIHRGQDRINAAVAGLAAAARTLDEHTIVALASVQDVIAATAIELAEAIIGRELSDGDTSARSALARALSQVDAAVVHVVRMNPADLAVLDASARDTAGVRFVADATLSRGDAVTEVADGYLDARIGTALARAKAALLGVEGEA